MKGVVLRLAEADSGRLKQTRPPRRVALPLKSWSALSAWGHSTYGLRAPWT